MPEQGIGFFSQSLAQACADDTRLSTPVERVVVDDGVTKGVITKDGFIEADAVICATTAPAALDIVPDFPEETRNFLANQPCPKNPYSRGYTVGKTRCVCLMVE